MSAEARACELDHCMKAKSTPRSEPEQLSLLSMKLMYCTCEVKFDLQHGEEVGAEARACAAAQGVEQEEALEAVAGLSRPPQPLQQLLVVLGAVGVVALGPVVSTPTHIAQHLPLLKQPAHPSLHSRESRLVPLACCCSDCVFLAFHHQGRHNRLAEPAAQDIHQASSACREACRGGLDGLLVPPAMMLTPTYGHCWKAGGSANIP